MFRRSLIWIVCVAGLVNGLTGCVYYNTFYNTKKEFNQAEKLRKKTGVGSQSGYKTAIDKALKIIENHPNSKYYDDALYVLAVSYFYTQQYPRAERRFRELMANYPDSKYSRQSMVYLAQSKLKIDEHEEAIEIFEEIFSEKYDKAYKADAAMELGLYHIEEKDFSRARSYFLAVRDSLGNDAQKIKAQRYIADTYFDAFDFGDALSAYLQILGMNPDKNLKYHALHNAAICSYRLQRIDAGLAYLDELAKDQLYYDSLGAIQLTMAMGYEYAGDRPQAEELYTDVASKSNNGTWVTEANYQLGLLYQFDYDDLPKAKEYYDKAIKGNQSTESGKDAVQRSADIAKLQMIEARKKAKQDEEANRLKNPEAGNAAGKTGQASQSPETPKKISPQERRDDRDEAIVGRSGQTVEEGSTEIGNLAARDTTATGDTVDSIDTIVATETPATETSSIDTLTIDSTIADTTPTDSASVVTNAVVALAGADSTRADSLPLVGAVADSTLADSLPLVGAVADSTRADSLPLVGAVADSTRADSLSQVAAGADSTLPDSLRTDTLAPVPPESPATRPKSKLDSAFVTVDSAAIERKRLASLESDADVIFQLAELYWFQLNKPDSAIEELKGLITNYPTTSYAPRAMLALSTMYRDHLSDTTGADSILQEAYEQYSHTDYAPEIFRTLNLKGTPADTGYPEYYYRLAEDFLIDSNNVDSARFYYQYVVDNFPKSRFALKARFNTVWLTENYQNPGDSSVIFAYQEIIDSFPGTDQANEAEKQLAYKPPKKKRFIDLEAEKSKERDTIQEMKSGEVLVAKPVTVAEPDTEERYIDPKERIYTGPKGEPLILVDIRPIETRVEFVYPDEAQSVEGYQFEVYFQILLDFSGRVADYVLKSPAPHDEINRRAEKTVASMSFDPLEVNRELTRKSEVVTLPEEQEDKRGRWYVYKFIVEKPDYMK